MVKRVTFNPEWIRKWEKLAWKGADNIAGRMTSAALGPMSWIYRRCLPKNYEIQKLPRPVISIGNITVGGSGKTPFTILLAGWLGSTLHKRVAVLSRGYRKESRKEVTVVSDGAQIVCSPAEAGDEAFLTAQKVPSAVVITAINRYEAGRMATEDYDAEVILLDDGFQHRKLDRQLDLVMLDSQRGIGNGRLLPAGPMREPLSALERADWLILFHRPGASPKSLRQIVHGVPYVSHKVLEVKAAAGSLLALPAAHRPGERCRLEQLVGGHARSIYWFLISGIADPASFEQAAAAEGLTTLGHVRFSDHHVYQPSDWEQILRAARLAGAKGILTTEKDFWKLVDTAPPEVLSVLRNMPLACLPLRLELGRGREEFLADLQRIAELNPEKI
jgi:tetraacyldisaccharide 4'-kinase